LKRFTVLACGRRWGKTTLAIDRALRVAVAGKPVGWFSPSYKLLAEAWREMLGILSDHVNRNKDERLIELPGGGSIEFWTLEAPAPARSRAYHLVIIDEAGHAPDLKTQWETEIRPCLADYAPDSSALFMSTPNGLNFFYSLFFARPGSGTSGLGIVPGADVGQSVHPQGRRSNRRVPT
jgi:hypothetical protein